MNARQFTGQAEKVMDAFLDDLKTIVNIDSGTFTKPGVDQVAAYLRERFHAFGFDTRLERQEQYGDHLIATHTGNNPNGPRILLIGHTDTVFPAGEAQRRPFTITRRDNQRVALGPGVLDMKSGLLIAMYALHLLIAAKQASYREVTVVCNSDEEIGSPTSRALIQELARQSDAALVFEPGRALSTVVSSRRASGQYRVTVHGLSAHAGVEPQKGRNAILELSYQIQKMHALNGAVPGTSLCVSVIHGGDRVNVVPDYAYFDVDARAGSRSSVQALEAAMQRVVSQHVLSGTRIELSGSMLSAPFERSKQNEPLVRLVKESGKDLGIDIQDVGSGGASDANNTAAVGTPTLDGLGAGGGLAHNPGEYVDLDYLPARIALVAGLIERIGENGM